MPSRHKKGRTAMTLIEVLAGLLILSFLLVAVLRAQKGNIDQIANAETTLRAVDVADQILEEWFASDQEIPRSGQGEKDGFQWSTQIQNESGPFGTSVIRLQIKHTIELEGNAAEIEGNAAPIVSVDLFVPSSEEPDSTDVQDEL